MGVDEEYEAMSTLARLTPESWTRTTRQQRTSGATDLNDRDMWPMTGLLFYCIIFSPPFHPISIARRYLFSF